MSDSALLSGHWHLIKAELGGENSPELLALCVELEFDAVTYVVRFAGEIADHGIYTLAGSALTLTGTAGPNEGRIIPCLWQCIGDRLRVCYGLDGTAPAAFATTAGSPHYLATYRRKAT